MTCAIAGCRSHTAGWNRFCNAHNHAYRRHGHAEQAGITVRALKRHLAAINRRIKLNAGNPSWPRLDAAWMGLADECRQQMKIADTSGRAFYKHEYAAHHEIVNVAD